MSNTSIPLYNLGGLSASELDKLLSEIRSTDYIAEVSSGEVEPEQSGLWDQVLPIPAELHSSDEIANLRVEKSEEDQEKLAEHALSVLESDERTKGKYANGGIVVADERTKSGDGSLLVLQIVSKGSEKKVVDSMRCAPRSLIEVCSNLAVANMGLAEYKNMCGNAEVFDAGQ
ncbi:unnamed protein product [Tilletia controversa]|uniref:DUF6924 domain-containing protein n=3 Tax=Tilletia TaxID=13289 RepID=A0A8X7MPQ6_9BASI|nr:hypothetical protein CF335_g5392 [Tilletia laevis]KAE8204801.1 hypothetical protein CF328_g873 [Tilletia controversa]KAE8264941.1 hypothetical protein A4X03_0g596 [Tilletia caries]KAE8200015.1 hypothetical protein CF336_g921 [Tilletia laevis]KAE8243461.1 hypothetical protein A4X06_0g6299 [Tilletia controversa]